MRAGLPAVLVLMVMAASAQQAKPERQLRCDIGLAEAPRPLGLELGMTVEEVSRVLLESAEKRKQRSARPKLFLAKMSILTIPNETRTSEAFT
jgi:hypothetical protein